MKRTVELLGTMGRIARIPFELLRWASSSVLRPTHGLSPAERLQVREQDKDTSRRARKVLEKLKKE